MVTTWDVVLYLFLGSSEAKIDCRVTRRDWSYENHVIFRSVLHISQLVISRSTVVTATKLFSPNCNLQSFDIHITCKHGNDIIIKP